MIIKNHINIVKSLYYVRYELTLALLTSLLVYLVFDVAEVESFAVPNVLPVFLGPALAIFLGFRSNAAYARWGEAAQLWSAIIAQSRTFGRLICTFVESHKHVDSYDPETAIAFQKEMIYRHLAWVHALRLHLRGETSCNSWKEQVEVFLSDEDWKSVASKQNKPYALSILQGNRIYDGMRLGTLQGFDSFQLEGCLAQFSTLQAYCERIKHTPIPRQYTFFTRMFVWFFIVTIPFSLIETFAMVSRTWVIIPVTVVLAYVFAIIERTGAVNEEPFENRLTDVPLTARCVEIEQDMRDLLNESWDPTNLHAAPTKDGYLF